MTEVAKVFVGHDHVEEVAFNVLVSSIVRRASIPVSITPIKLEHISHFFDRPRDEKQSNAFSFSRFMAPYICNYEGWSLFMDCDMVMKCDIKDIWNLRDDRYAIQVCKHDYTPKETVKYLGNVQYQYPRKNWSSVMLMNNAKCKALTPEYVMEASGLQLHRFLWLDDSEIGELPLEYNWLVGEYPENPEAQVLHYTLGGPYFDEYANCDHSIDWFEEKAYALHCQQRR